MTIEEKVGQCLMPALYSQADIYTENLLKQYIEDYHIGGIVLMQGNRESVKALASIAGISKIPMFIAIDAEWGLGMRLEDATIFPINGNLPSLMDETEVYDYGREIAVESRDLGINMVLGPVIDVVSGNKGIIGKRSFGDDPETVSQFGIAYAKGLESGGVISVAKHFPGHGNAINDSHLHTAKTDKDILALDSVDLKPFRDYINLGLSGIMAGHIQAKALDPGGAAASVSMDMLTSLLREEMGFKGLILTDAFDMGGAKGFSSVDAIKAGADLILCPKNLKKEYNYILQSVKDGVLNEEILTDRCRDILFTKLRFL